MDGYRKKYFTKLPNGSLTFSTITIDNNNPIEEQKSNIIHNRIIKYPNINPIEEQKSNIIDNRIIKYRNINPIDFIKNGGITIKLCRTSKGMNFRYFYVNNGGNYLRWFSPSKKYKYSYIKITEITNIKKEPNKCFYKNLYPFLEFFPDDNIHELALKITYLEGYETGLKGMPFQLKKNYKPNKAQHLYLIFKNKIELNLWYRGLLSLVDNRNIKKYIPNNEVHKSKIELSLYINDHYKYEPLFKYTHYSKLKFDKNILDKEIRKHRNKIFQRFKKLKKMNTKLHSSINHWIIPILETSLNLTNICLKKLDSNDTLLSENDSLMLGQWLYQMKLEYAVIKNIIDILKVKELEIHMDKMIPYII